MKIAVKGIDAELAKIRKYLKDTSDKADKTKASEMLTALIAATPIDTGEARRGWTIQQIRNGFRLVNNVPYIEMLNNGHSKQAPSHFIERVLLSHGKAIGAIVIKTPD